MTKNDQLPGALVQQSDPEPSFPAFLGNYVIDSTILGVGNFATVCLGTHVPTGEKVALKMIPKKALVGDDLRKIHREIVIAQALRHPHIIRTYQTIEDQDHIAVVMEYASGGEMYEQLTKRGHYDEPEARRLFRQIVAAVRYCHSLHVIHRDLKTENLLLDGEQNVKLADFGFSDVTRPGDKLEEWCGSLPYAAPELFEGLHYNGFKSDLWSLGIVLYVMVTGALPFDGESLADTRALILTGSFTVPSYVSDGCASLLRALLVVDPTQRCDLNYVIRHPWLFFESAGSISSTHFWPEDCLDPENPADDSELNECVLDEMESHGHTRQTVRHDLRTEPFHDVSITYHLLNDKFSRNLPTDFCLPSLPIPISQQSSRRSSILTGTVARDETSSPTNSCSRLSGSSTTSRRASLPPTMSGRSTMTESWSWPSSVLTTKKHAKSFRGLRRASDGAVPSPLLRRFSSLMKRSDTGIHSIYSDYSLSKEFGVLSMDDSDDEEPDLEAVQRYLSLRGKTTRHTTVGGTSGGKRSSSVFVPPELHRGFGTHAAGPRADLRRHSDNPTCRVVRTSNRSGAYAARPVSPMDEMNSLQRHLDSGLGSPSFSGSPANLSPQRLSLCSAAPASPNSLAVPFSGTFPARLNAAFSSPSFLDKLYGGIRIRVTADDESHGAPPKELRK